jgi:MATE family multidrug resistance protein
VLVVTAVVSRLGSGPAAAYGIGSRIDQVAIFACAGWGAAAATAVGQGLGARDPRGAARAGWCAVALAAAWMVVLGTGFALGAESLVRSVGRGDAASEVVPAGVDYLRIAVLGYPFMGAALVLSMALAGAGSVWPALLVEAGVLWGVQVPLVLAVAPEAGGPGALRPVWWALAGSYVLLAAAYAAVFAAGRWKR